MSTPNGAATTALLKTQGLYSGYGGVPAIRDLNIEIGRGEVVVLLGANGAGKTTTALTLAGAIKPISGELHWRGEPTHAPLHRRIHDQLALVTDDRTVFMTLTLAENLRVANVDERKALELFPELQPHVNRKVGMLSGGQQQMLSLGRALASGPDMLIADELSVGLAPVIVKRLFHTVRQAADGGVGVLLVEQFARRALAIADRAYVLKHGEIALTGAADELLGRFDEIERAYLAEG